MIDKKQKSGRITAVELLMKQEQNGYSNLVLDAQLKRNALDAREKAFASAVFYGVLERLYTLDWMLQKCVKQPLAKLDAPVRAILRAGLYQAMYMDSVPASAAVNESVQLTRVFRKSSASGFVNAVLRKAMKQNPQNAQFASRQEQLSVQYSVSLPIAEHFLRCYPQDAEHILAAFFQKPALTLRANTLKTSAEQLCRQLAEEGWQAQPGELAGSVVAQGKGSIVHTEAFLQGLFHVQGMGSQLACSCLSPKPGTKVLDLCAAPGGKTATLAQMMENRGQLLCGDAVEARVPLIETLAARLGLSIVEAHHWDAAASQEGLENADFVLCDVPCSGLGIMAKKPDIRTKDLKQMQQLYPLQQQILRTGASYLKTGGRLVYSTCTLNPDENENQVKQFLHDMPSFRLVEPPCTLNGAIVQDNMMTLRPDQNGQDGFFIAVLERVC